VIVPELGTQYYKIYRQLKLGGPLVTGTPASATVIPVGGLYPKTTSGTGAIVPGYDPILDCPTVPPGLTLEPVQTDNFRIPQSPELCPLFERPMK
jgi:hypothetical protein